MAYVANTKAKKIVDHAFSLPDAICEAFRRFPAALFRESELACLQQTLGSGPAPSREW